MGAFDDRLKGDAARLWRLVAQRIEAGVDTDALDRRIWELFGERRAVMFTDLVGFSRAVADFGIIHFLQLIYEHKQLLAPIIEANDGVLIKSEADSLLISFRNPERALRCAIEMQNACHRFSARRHDNETIELCIGLGYGDVLCIGDHDLWGAEINAASKLGEDTAAGGEVLVTEAIRAALGELDSVSFEALDLEIPGTARAYRASYSIES